MTETAMAALFRAVHRQLTVAGEPWGAAVYPNLAPAGAAYPYVLYNFNGGGERNSISARDAEIVLVVKAVSDQLSEAFAAAARIDTLLNDMGTQDTASGYLYPGSDSEWSVLTATTEDAVSYQEMMANASPLYHAGARYRFIMEAI